MGVLPLCHPQNALRSTGNDLFELGERCGRREGSHPLLGLKNRLALAGSNGFAQWCRHALAI